MQDILQHINSVEGVIGSAIFSQKGEVLAHALPTLVDAASLKKASELALECAHGLQISLTLDILDMRYSDGRIVVKRFPGALIFLLCAKNINLHVLAVTLNLAVKKLQLPGDVSESASAVSGASQSAKASDGILRLPVSHLTNKQASASFDSLGMIAVSQSTSQFITDFYKTTSNKLTLTNAVAGTSGTFPVMVMKDMDPKYDGTIVVGPGIEKRLKVVEGDEVEVRI